MNDSINSKFTRKVSIMVGDLISSQPNFDVINLFNLSKKCRALKKAIVIVGQRVTNHMKTKLPIYRIRYMKYRKEECQKRIPKNKFKID